MTTPVEPSQLNELFDINPGPVCRVGVNGTISFANRAAVALFGPEHPVGRSWLDVCPATPPSLWKRIIGGSDPVRFDARFDAREYSMVLVHHRGEGCIYAYGTDVTDLLESERTLTRHIAELAAMGRFPEMNPGLTLRVSREGNVVLANYAARKQMHDDDLIGRSWIELCPGMDETKWAEILEARDDTNIEARIDDRDMLITHTGGANSWDIFVFGTDLTAQKAAEAALRQSEKMATLGTLAAGVAHELNNPASAASRAAGQLAEAIEGMHGTDMQLARLQMSDAEVAALTELLELTRMRATSEAEDGGMTCADREVAVERWLDAHGIEDGWDLAPDLVQLDLDPPALDRLSERFQPAHLHPALRWACQARQLHRLRVEVATGSTRVAEIVGALKSYTYLGQAPEQQVDVNEGIRNTMIIFHSRLEGLQVDMELAGDLPRITATGSELNEVWTHLIDNAIWAMAGRGDLIVRSSREGNAVVVEVEDTGPGIPEADQSRVFDPFFTTRAPGEGSGLGLNTVHGIVVKKHGGRVDLESRPGRTVFRVALPIDST